MKRGSAWNAGLAIGKWNKKNRDGPLRGENRRGQNGTPWPWGKPTGPLTQGRKSIVAILEYIDYGVLKKFMPGLGRNRAPDF